MIGIAPRADLEAAAYPAELFGGVHAGLIAADHALCRARGPLQADRLPRALDDLGSHNGFGLCGNSALPLVFHYISLLAHLTFEPGKLPPGRADIFRLGRGGNVVAQRRGAARRIATGDQNQSQ